MSFYVKLYAASATVVALSVGIADFARAQAPPAPSGGPTIATPGQAATVEKVEKAKDVAQAAALTPIVPSPNDPTRPAFQLYAEVDLPLVGMGVVFAAARLVRSQQAYCAPECDPADLNA